MPTLRALRPFITVVTALAITLAIAACQGATPGADGPRVIAVTTTDDLRFDPEAVTVAAGETVRFEVSNPTALQHEFVIGDAEEQMHHGQEMEGMDGEMAHDDDNAVSVAPGETKELTYTFGGAGTLLIGCHVDGHYAAGMAGTITVEN